MMTSKSIENQAIDRAEIETRDKAGKTDPEVKTAFDIFGSQLPDEFFAGIFDHRRLRGGWKVDP